MSGDQHSWRSNAGLVPPMLAPLHQNAEEEDQQWSSNFNISVNAVYMGFVATAVLISMFLVMAIFERFFRRPRTSQLNPTATSQTCNNPKLDPNSSNMTNFAREVSVMMPGEDIPTYIGHPAPVPCPPEHITWPLHQHKPNFNPSSS